MAQIYGELIRAQLQSSATDLSPTATGLVYFNTSTGLKWHTGSGWKIAADLDSSQTLAGKTLDATCSINVSALPIVSLAKGGLGADASAWSGFLKISAGVASAASISASDLPIVTAAKGGLGADASAFTGVVKSSSGVFSASTIVNADVSASAAIAGTKISPDFGSQNVTTTGSVGGVNVLNAGYEEFTQIATPSNPTATKIRVYTKSDGKLYRLDSAGNETAVGSGSGSGGVNYLVDWYDATKAVGTVSTVAVGGNVTVSGSFPAVTSAWYADTTSGSAAIASSSDNTLRSTANYLTAVSGVSTSGATFVQSPVFNIDGKDLGTALTVQFDVSGNTTDNDWDVVAVRYNSSGVYQELIPIAGNVSTMTGTPSAKLPLGVKQFNGFFITGSTASDVYAIRWRRRAGSAQIRLDSLTVGPNQVLQGAIVETTKLTSGEFTLSGVSNTAGNIYLTRRGNTAYVQGSFNISGAPTTTLVITPSSKYAIDTSLTSTGTQVGAGIARDDSAGARYVGGIIRVGSGFQISGPTSGEFWNATVPFIFANADSISFQIEYPVSGWDSNTQQAARAVEEYAYNTATWTSGGTTEFANGPQGAAMAGALGGTTVFRCRFQTPILSTDKVSVELSTDRVVWYSAGEAIVNGQRVFSSINSTGGDASGVLMRNVSGSNTDVEVVFGRYMNMENDDGGATSWPTAGNGYWRVRKVSSGAAVGFPIAPANITLIDNSENYGGNTKLGLMTYAHGGSYNGAAAPTITLSSGGGTLSSIRHSEFIPYQMANGTWRMKFNFNASVSATVRTSAVFAINGVTFKNVSSNLQTIAALQDAGSYLQAAYVNPNANTARIDHTSGNTSTYAFSGDVALESKPTWAY